MKKEFSCRAYSTSSSFVVRAKNELSRKAVK